jgi:hypothetical protein
MGGCTNCASKGGCSTRKGEERALLAQLLPELYPTRRWGEPDERKRDGVPEREGRRLARQASSHLRAPAWFRPGAPEQLCDFIWVLCVGREPGLLSYWDAPTIDHVDGTHVREKYLRVALSSLARVATVQEVTLSLGRESGAWQLEMQPSPGVYDPILLERTRQLVELLVAADLTFLDFGLIERPPDGFDAGAYDAAGGDPPGVVSYLFYPEPPRQVATQWVP